LFAPADSWSELVLLAQDGEGFSRFYFFIAVVVIMAIKHVVEKIKAAGEERHSQTGQSRTFDEHEEEEVYFEEEPQGYNDPNPRNDTLLEFFREASQGLIPGQVPTPPTPAAVPPPSPRKVERPKTPPKTSAVVLTSAERLALEKLKKSTSNLHTGRSHRQRLHASAEHSELGRMLRDPASLRNAFILKEVLEPPLAAREEQAPYEI
jgi:hypothetical protein